MSDLILQRSADTSLWDVTSPGGHVVAGPCSRSAAVDEAMRRVALSGGGKVRGMTSEGRVYVVRTVPAGTDSEPGNNEAWDLATKAAAHVDELRNQLVTSGDHNPAGGGGALDDIGDLDVTKLLGNGAVVRSANRHASVAAALLGVLALFGGGGLSAIVADARRAAASTATVQTYATVGETIFATFALSVCACVAWYACRSSAVTSTGSVAILGLAMLAIVWFSTRLGFAGPTTDQVLAGMNTAGGSPVLKTASIFGTFLAFYSPLPFLSGVIAGSCLGNFFFDVNREAHPDAA